MNVDAQKISSVQDSLNEHLRDVIKWHFSEETGSPFWLGWKKENGFDPLSEISTMDDLHKFPHFQDEWLRDGPLEKWVPQPFKGKPFRVFETGGTTGMPKQRISWEDHLVDYSEFSKTLCDEDFPKGGHWLMVGPTGPRRLRLAIEHLANVRGGSCFHVDLDPRWVIKLLHAGEVDQAKNYSAHVVDQAVTILKNREISCLFTTPKLLEAIGEKISIPKTGIKGVFCGGTSMTPQMIRFLVEEVLEEQVAFVPTYGNTLMGLACSRPFVPEDQWIPTYYPPVPRAILRVVNPEKTSEIVDYGQRGRVELTTLTKEIFIPRFLERDEATRAKPCDLYPWDGVAAVTPIKQVEQTKVIEGVY